MEARTLGKTLHGLVDLNVTKFYVYLNGSGEIADAGEWRVHAVRIVINCTCLTTEHCRTGYALPKLVLEVCTRSKLRNPSTQC
jgi:hypothetical protein